MKKGIILLTRIKKEAEQLSDFLIKRNYRARVTQNMENLDQLPDWKEYITVLWDLDSIPTDNRTIRRLALKHPRVHFLCLSQKRIHPDLKEAICNHFYACLKKPLDLDEFLYWIKCAEDNSAAGNGSRK